MLTKLTLRAINQTQRCVPRSAKELSSIRRISTIDAQKVSTFRKVSSIWWDKTSEMKALHALNELRVPFVRDGLVAVGTLRKELIDTPKPLQNLLILDAGCGGGILAEPIAKLGGTVIGVDPIEELIEQARDHAKLDPSLSGIRYSVGTIEDHAITNSEKYDAVLVCEVLAHVAEKELLLESCVKCLKPGGSIFVSTINKTVMVWLLGTIVFERLARSMARGVHVWDKFIKPSEAQRILESYKCKTRYIRGFGYNPFTNRWYWSTNTSLYYALHAVKC